MRSLIVAIVGRQVATNHPPYPSSAALFGRKSSESRNRRTFSSVKGTAARKVCIVGGGPAGFYAAQYLVKHLPDVRVDIVEKLPVPFGLVRFGVAPDHPEVKNVINTFTKTAQHPNVRFLGNLELGRDFSVQDLRDRYHAVILAYGADRDRHLNIPNETATSVLSAREFVAWYNGLPGSQHFAPRLADRQSVAIVGQGNVAVDVARILLAPIDQLQRTDITAAALRELRLSQVRRVHLVGRRGPLQAAFTIKELREMTKLPSVHCRWRPDDFGHLSAEAVAQLARPRRRLTQLMLDSMGDCAADGSGGDCKEFRPLFLRSPLRRVDDGLQLSVNRLVDGCSRAEATADTELLRCDLVLRSIGYKARNLDASVNFDEGAGHVRQVGGRVLRLDAVRSDSGGTECADYEGGLYACGWLATGPTGVILTTMANAFEVARAVCEDLAAPAAAEVDARPGLGAAELEGRRVVDWEAWQRIDGAEIAAAAGTEKPREKIVDVEEMLRAAGL